MFYFISNLCTNCSFYLDFCPVGAISGEDIYKIDRKKCIDCGICYHIFPQNAIECTLKIDAPQAIYETFNNLIRNKDQQIPIPKIEFPSQLSSTKEKPLKIKNKNLLIKKILNSCFKPKKMNELLAIANYQDPLKLHSEILEELIEELLLKTNHYQRDIFYTTTDKGYEYLHSHEEN